MVIGTPTVLNLIPGGVMKVIHVNQVNENIEIQFRIMNGAQPFNVPEGVSCTIRGTKGDNFGYAADVAVTAGSNIVTVTLTEQLTAVAGAGNIFELVFVGASDDMKVSTENFILDVERAALGEDTVVSDSDLAYADQVLNQLQSVGAVNAQVQQNKANIAAEITRATAAEQTLQQNINAEAAARQAADNTLQSNINAEASSRATTDASLQSQINQLVAPSGSAPSAAEVENARVGSDGTVYPTLGDAIRTQNSLLKSHLEAICVETSVNLYNSGEVQGFVQSDGSIATNGSWANYATGTITLDAGTYTIYGYTPLYNISGSRYGVAIINGSTVETYFNEYFTDNHKTITITGRRTLKISAISDVLKMVVKGSTVISPYQQYDPYVLLADDLSMQLDNGTSNVKLEIGTITTTNNVPAFYPNNQRVRTAEPLDLVSGDVIGLTDYSNAEFDVYWQNNLGGYGYEPLFFKRDYVVRFSGKYWILIRNTPEVRQTKVSTLGNLLKIVRCGNDHGADINKTDAIIGINHRGYAVNKYFPENTLIAFKASKMYGFDAVETDVAFTSDDVPVLLHDATINRTARNSDGTAISETIDIGSITYAQALNYDFGIYAQDAYAGTKIPTFEQFISLCKNIGLHPYIELKDNNGVTYAQSLILGLVDMVNAYGMSNNVTWTSFNADYLRWISAYDPKASLQLTVFTITERMVEIVTDELRTGQNDVCIASQSFSDAEITLCKNAKIPLGVYTFNIPETMDTTPDYATMVTSDAINASEYFYNKNIAF